MQNLPVYINLVVRDLPAAKQFFAALGFEFNPQFTNDDAACIILNPQASVMLMTEAMFPRFSTRAICDTSKATEVLLALMCSEREAVDTMVHAAIAAGGTHAMDPADYGFMYNWSFYDLDGHHWEVGWMNPEGMPPA